jgi:hypothetical protein
LLERLASARRAGLTFDQAWPTALGEAVRVAHRRDREEWAEVLGSMSSSWRAAFERRPATGPELALAIIATDSDRVPMPERECERCRRAIPDDRGRKGAPAKFCGEDCRREAHRERWQTAA